MVAPIGFTVKQKAIETARKSLILQVGDLIASKTVTLRIEMMSFWGALNAILSASAIGRARKLATLNAGYKLNIVLMTFCAAFLRKLAASKNSP